MRRGRRSAPRCRIFHGERRDADIERNGLEDRRNRKSEVEAEGARLGRQRPVGENRRLKTQQAANRFGLEKLCSSSLTKLDI